MNDEELRATLESLSEALPTQLVAPGRADPRVTALVCAALERRQELIIFLNGARQSIQPIALNYEDAPAGVRRILVDAFDVDDPHDPTCDVYLHAVQIALGVDSASLSPDRWATSFDNDRVTTVAVLEAMVLMAAGARSLTRHESSSPT